MSEPRPPSPPPPMRHLMVLTGVGLALALATALALAHKASVAQAAGEASLPAGTPAPASVASEAVLAAFVPPPMTPVEAPVPELAEPWSVRGELRSGDTLAESFARAGAPRDTAFRVARWMKPHYDFRRKARGGHTWELGLDPEGRFLDFRYWTSQIESYHLFLDEAGEPQVRVEQAALVAHVGRLRGVVETTLFDAVVEHGEDVRLARDFADIFAWDLDFSRSVRPGDEFSILYERLHRVLEDGTELYMHPGPILAAHYAGSEGEHRAVYFETEQGRGGYYRPDGTSVRGQFLKAPLRFVRISSSYSSGRLHPILKIKRPHHGIDYAAPAGEPVWSVADGKVIYRGWAGGFGNLIKVRHANGYVSYYAHLSRFARGLQEGSRVQQKQVIGYVGQTGLATGPHVCFRIAQHGRFVNPTQLRVPSGEPVPEAVRAVFEDTRDLLLAELDGGPVLARDASR